MKKDVEIDKNISASINNAYIYSNYASWNIERFALKIALHRPSVILFLTILYNIVFSFYRHPCDLFPAYSHFIAIHAYYSLFYRAQK